MSLAWALLPAGFGVKNFSEKQTQVWRWLAHAAWMVLLFAHFVAIYYLWSDFIALSEIYYHYIGGIVLFQILFLATFARDVST